MQKKKIQVAGINLLQIQGTDWYKLSERTVISQKGLAAVITFQYIQIPNYLLHHISETNITTYQFYFLKKTATQERKKKEWIRWFQRSSENHSETLVQPVHHHHSGASRKTRKRLTTVPRQKASCSPLLVTACC